MDNKLKPCPFCGGEARLIGHSPYSITCCKCRATTVICDTPEKAINEWNRRVMFTFTFRELYAIYEVFTVPNPSRFLTDGYHSIVEKCELALKGGSNEKH